ncbi:MAG: PIN domain-containing protein [Treponema sp.]|nr:PIN domain-containing protein [Treponema sp.]
MTLVDTNVILRYLLNDIPEKADKAASMIEEGAFTLPEIVAEVVYVLVKLYEIPREEMKNIISPIFDEIFMENSDVMSAAISYYSETKLDFVDCIILARKKILNESVFTFDKKLLNRLKDI